MGYRGQKNCSLTVAALSGVALLTTLIITKRHDHLFVAKRRGDAQANSAPLQSQVINPTPDTHRSPNTLVFLSSHFQNSSRWLRTASILSAQGYQCHLVHLGLGNISKSLVALREYIESVDSQNGTSRVVLFGHSLGGTLAQLYARHPSNNPVSGMVLLASCGIEEKDVRCMRESLFPPAKHEFFSYCVDLLLQNVARSIWLRHKILPKLFCDASEASSTTLTTKLEDNMDSVDLLQYAAIVDCLSDAEAPFLQIEESIGEGEEPATPTNESPKSLTLSSHPSLLPLPTLNLLPENDLLIPKESYYRTSKLWNVESKIVVGQGHNCGDVGWEGSTMGIILDFLRTTTFPFPSRQKPPLSEANSDSSSDSFVNVGAPDDEDGDDIELDFGDLAGATEISDEDAASWRSYFSWS
ncbi:hypothetical protein TrVE_jg8122 [Triparma verrucosa]|uniref:AB hydrolase-1 domain-containing protein n=1 Tax=Triparma verrucosa TaxID=1606542 RepID=A0A9W7BGA5_9STRA|nr:hypothetical protein TrVE_jg8122 [Triparma verrucosa]